MVDRHYMTEAGKQAIIEACREHQAKLSELRSQRPFRSLGKTGNVVSIASARKPRNVLLGLI